MAVMTSLINAGQPFLGAAASTLGISAKGLEALVSQRQVRRVLRGVYVDAAAPDTRALRAACLHLVRPPNAVFYGISAAFLLGVDVTPPYARFRLVPECIVPHHSTRCTQLLVRCREGYLPPADLLEVEGLLITNAVRTTADLLRSLWRPYALAAADAMARAGLVTTEAVMAYVAPMKRFPGIVQARALSPLIDGLAESAGESWLRLRLIDAGFPIPRCQIVVVNRAGFEIARIDDGYDAVKVGVEYDGREFHTEDADRQHDQARRDLLREVYGWRIAVALYGDIFGEDPALELEVGGWLGIPPQLPRRW
jgi:hypothetical protein